MWVCMLNVVFWGCCHRTGHFTVSWFMMAWVLCWFCWVMWHPMEVLSTFQEVYITWQTCEYGYIPQIQVSVNIEPFLEVYNHCQWEKCLSLSCFISVQIILSYQTWNQCTDSKLNLYSLFYLWLSWTWFVTVFCQV